jgi:hypothetical protein
MTKRLLRSAVIAAMLTTLWIAPSRAGSLLQKQMDFLGGNSPSSTLSYTTGGSLSVQNAIISSITAFPSFKKLGITNGLLDFVTATCLTNCQTTFVKNTNSFAATPIFNWGGHLIITGHLAGMTGVQTLLSGTFSQNGLNSAGKNGSAPPSASLSTASHKGGFNGSLDITSINPEIYADFLPYIFQVPSGTGRSYMSEMWLSLNFTATGPGTKGHVLGNWTGAVASTDILVKPTPEPSGLFLLASVLLVGAGLLRRRANLTA